MKTYTADFETTVDPNDCRVWAFAICDLDDFENVIFGNCIEDFIDVCENLAPCKMYFHNLAFDGAFIMSHLERTEWEWCDELKAKRHTYETLINDMNTVYSITLCFGKRKRVTFWDSFKVIPMKVERMAKEFHLPEQKLTLDYETFREKGHELTEHEREYIKHDVVITARVLDSFLNDGLVKMTAASNALSDYAVRTFNGKGLMRKTFPVIPEFEDEFVRKSYKGGYCFRQPQVCTEEHQRRYSI